MTARTAKLCQIVAAEKGRRAEINRQVTDWYHKLQKGELFQGQLRQYKPLDEENGVKLPDERQVLQQQVPTVLAELSKLWTALFDITATKDFGNQTAKADVVVDGTVLVPQAPVPYLLWLEKQLTDLHTVIGKIPTLDPGIQWTLDPNTDSYRAAPVDTNKTEKQPQSYEKSPATDKHPAQVEFFWKDVTIGTWTTTKFSGALPAREVREMLDRLAKVRDAVKYAREEANGTVVEDVQVGQAVFDFVLGR